MEELIAFQARDPSSIHAGDLCWRLMLKLEQEQGAEPDVKSAREKDQILIAQNYIQTLSFNISCDV